jgi:acyl carrier protein
VSNEIFDTVAILIANIKRISPDRVTPDSTLEELKMDSLDGLDLLLELEDAFHLKFPDERARAIHTVREIVEEIVIRIAGV